MDLAFVQNDAKDNLSLSASYTIPWLYLDYLDLQEVRTSLSFSLFSTPIGNNKLLDGSTETGWEYTERRTGASFSLSRPFSQDLENLRLSLGLSARRSAYALEVHDPNAPCNPAATDPNDPKYCDGTGYKNPSLAQSLLPTPGWTLRLDTGLTYTDVDNPRFRTQGYEASLSTGLGLSFPDTGGRSFFVPETRGNQWGNGAISNCQWTGVRLRDLLRAAGVKHSAKHVAPYGKDTHLSGDPN
ncbi:MAG: molybdopterin-dependent oxidoreductase, partial [Candidatus Omnitrophica bacterium]|nr:molybdopterin-dependent oxidoreductase [Candidatus Omnitrophota bacterium]